MSDLLIYSEPMERVAPNLHQLRDSTIPNRASLHDNQLMELSLHQPCATTTHDGGAGGD